MRHLIWLGAGSIVLLLIGASCRDSKQLEPRTPSEDGEDHIAFEKPDFEAQLERGRAENRHIAETFSKALDAEVRDEPFATETEDFARRALAPVPGSDLVEVLCKRTFCRMVTTHIGGDARDRFIDELGFMPPFNTAGWSYFDPDDEKAVTLYFLRKGEFELPEIPELTTTKHAD